MKILRICGDFYPKIIGGVGLHAYYMSKLQAEKGNEVKVYTFYNKNENVKEKNLEIVYLKPLLRMFGNPITFSLIFKLYKEVDNYDIVHAHSHLFFTTNIVALLRKFKKFNFVITNHGIYSQTVPIFLQDIYFKTLGKFTLNAADKIITYTNTEKEKLIELGVKKEKIEVIHNGIDTSLFKKNRQNDNKTILWVGRFVEGKGISNLSSIIKYLINRDNQIKFTIIGNGPLKEIFLDSLNGYQNNITFIEKVENKEMPKLYNSSDLLILTSSNEGVPRTILEAMSCELPVVCSNLPQFNEIITNKDQLINPKDTKKFSMNIFTILNNKNLYKKLGKQNREQIIKKFDWNDTVNKTLKLYGELL